jgi:hypothetical protein
VRQVADVSGRLQEAVAAYLEYLEMGGPEPDASHLTPAEQRELQELVEALELTDGVAFGRGRDETSLPVALAATAEGERLLAQLRESLPPGARIYPDDNTLVSHIGGIGILDRAIIGTLGGRVRVWLLDTEAAQAIEQNASCLADLDRVFRMFPDMSAIALVGRDVSCLIVQPEDCAPQIQVPSGSLVARRYKRAIQPAPEALRDYLDELVPYWDPMPAFDHDSGLRVDLSNVGDELVRAAIERQRGIGQRSRKGNPKREVLLAFGDKEVAALVALVKGLFDGTVDPAEVDARMERLARGR